MYIVVRKSYDDDHVSYEQIQASSDTEAQERLRERLKNMMGGYTIVGLFKKVE